MEDLALVANVVMLLSGLLLTLYPLKVSGTHPYVKHLICIILVLSVNLIISKDSESTGISYKFICANVLLALACVVAVFIPMVAVLASTVTLSGLLAIGIAFYLPNNWAEYVKIGACLAACVVILTWRPLLNLWEVLFVPSVGGYMISHSFRTDFETSGWVVVTLIGVILQLWKVRSLKKIEEENKENIKDLHYHLMKKCEDISADSDADLTPRSRIVKACHGDKEQIDRMLYGCGLY